MKVDSYRTGKDLRYAQWNDYRVPQKKPRDTIVSPRIWGTLLGDTILGDTIVSLVVSLNVSPTVSLEGHDRVRVHHLTSSVTAGHDRADSRDTMGDTLGTRWGTRFSVSCP